MTAQQFNFVAWSSQIKKKKHVIFRDKISKMLISMTKKSIIDAHLKKITDALGNFQ